jgi:4'-phosphopantetheinyl transferase
VGIDVEEIKPIDFDIAKRFFSSNEHRQFLQQPEDKKLAFFYDIWTMKEAVIKAEGKGLSIPLDSFTVLAQEGRIALEYEHLLERKDYVIKQYPLDPHYKMSVCACHHDFPAEFIIIKFEECQRVLGR